MTVVAADIDCPRIQVCFTPGEYCTGKIAEAINSAKNSLYIQAYSFTSAPIASAVVAAKRRGIDVRVILDKSQKTDKYSAAAFMLNQGVPTWIDNKVELAHNKVMIIDGMRVITGSFNFTNAAQKRNAENVVIIEDVAIARKYLNNWRRRFTSAEPLNETTRSTEKNVTRLPDVDEITKVVISFIKQLLK